MNVFAYVCVPHTNMPALVLGRTSALEIRGLHTVSAYLSSVVKWPMWNYVTGVLEQLLTVPLLVRQCSRCGWSTVFLLLIAMVQSLVRRFPNSLYPTWKNPWQDMWV
jgi:hypothetical protein